MAYSMSKCVECEEEKRLGYYDPREPPLREGLCMCEDCYGVVTYEIIIKGIRSVETYIAGFYRHLSDLDKIVIQNDLQKICERMK